MADLTDGEAADPRYVLLLNAVSANVTGPVIDTGDLKDELTLEVIIAGTVSAYSVQLQGSMDDVNWVSIGIPETSAGAPGTAVGPVTASTGPFAVSSGVLMRYFRAALTAYAGTGTVTAELAYGAGL